MAIYLTIEQVLEIHRLQIEFLGGGDGERDKGLIECALLRPRAGYYAEIFEEAAAIWQNCEAKG